MNENGLAGQRIALSMRVTQAPDYEERRDSISHDWVKWLSVQGAVPLLVPNLVASPDSYLNELSPDLLVLTGGDDLGDTPERDATEHSLLAHAMQSKLPVLGVCRGMQFINLYFEGTLSPLSGHVGHSHPVTVAPLWENLYRAPVTVNSFHDQGMNEADLGRDLFSFAYDKDGRIEGLHHRNQPIAGVMWHPERSGAPEGDARLMKRLLDDGAFWR